MKSQLTARFVSLLVLACLVLSGCSAPAPAASTAAPTQDSATIVAAAVSTISAQMTEEALRNPSPTPPPTSTPEPTSTPVPPTPTAEPFTATPSEPEPTATSETASYGPLSAELQYMTTYPENKREYVPNELFSLAIGFKNTGTITWEPGYTIKILRADGEITVAPEAELGTAIEPGQKGEFNLWAFGSETLGQHTWYFQVYNTNGGAVPGGYAAFTYTSY